MAYKFYFIRFSWRLIYQVGIVLNCLFSGLQMLLILGITFGLSPFLFALGDDVFMDLINGIQFLVRRDIHWSRIFLRCKGLRSYYFFFRILFYSAMYNHDGPSLPRRKRRRLLRHVYNRVELRVSSRTCFEHYAVTDLGREHQGFDGGALVGLDEAHHFNYLDSNKRHLLCRAAPERSP